MKRFDISQTKVSVIIAVYNCEVYIKQCLKSILCQTLYELEIICVDDGSTDKSPDIIEESAKQDCRIKLIRQKNQGAGSARNTGIQKAKGMYLAFLDADDYFYDKDALEEMVCACEKNNLLACGSLRMCCENNTERCENLFQKLFMSKNMKKHVVLNYKDYQLDYDFQSFIFRRDLLVQNQIYFPMYRRFQDPPFLVKALYKAEKFAVVNKYLYCYRIPTMVFRFNMEKTKDLIRGLTDNLVFAGEHGLTILFEKTLERLEYEYASIIYHNISVLDIELIDLLLKTNHIVCEVKKDENYIIRPLQRVLGNVQQCSALYEEKLLQKICKEEKIAIYGAGKLAKRFLAYLKEHKLINKVSYMIVTELGSKNCELEGVPVKEFTYANNENIHIYVAVGAVAHREICRNLHKENIESYTLLDDVFLETLPEV